jgi:presqualene diphosphate synthase
MAQTRNQSVIADGEAERAGTAIGIAAARTHVHEVVRRAGSSFFAAMRILPPERREAVYAIYAYCREVDDIADEDGESAAKMARLAAWRDEVERIYAGRPETPTGTALAGDVLRFALPREEFLRLIDAVEQDAGTVMHAPTLAELRRYCRGVAGAVGMLLIRIFGDSGPAAQEFAVALGEALQLTNILRDLAEDADRGRLYLPAELLREHGVETGKSAAEVLADPRIGAVCATLAALAERRFTEAETALGQADRKALRSALVMRDVYHELLRRLVRRGWRALDRPVRVGRLFKLSVALRHALF